MYTTRQDAEAMISQAIEAGGEVTDASNDYDLDAIFDENFEFSIELQQFVQTTSDTEFWASVERHTVEG